MIIKVCGMCDPQNIRQVASLGVNWIGLIFYPQSPRRVRHETFSSPSSTVNLRKVGVFVNATFEQMMEVANRCQLDSLQLHGDEPPELCFALQKRGIPVIKALSVSSAEDIEKAHVYDGFVDYFLFDTKCEGYGGSGRQFDWSILSRYRGKTPFLLSGGIHPDSVGSIRNFCHPQLIGLDLNSGFEIEPGLKDIGKLAAFLTELNIINH